MTATAQQDSRRKPRTRFVTALWGRTYIERFATLSLPSFLAPGNLPALAGATQLEVAICTRAADTGFFESHPAIERLRRLCPVRFIGIDDLVTSGVYGVTLTLAYARAVISCGEAMLGTHFVFMNADFVLADGSLRSLARHILAGRSIVLGPSFRATAEALEPELRAAVDAEGILAIAPRDLAALSLPHPHPTTIAKIRNQEVVHSTHPNQFFWQVDEHTLLGRYYLIFMLCLKPERVVTEINGYCDYAFIPEMCPGGDEVAMDDSDDFFMLELQGRAQELGMLRLGRQTRQRAAQSLAQWTTAEQRRAAGHDILFHAGEIPPSIGAAKAEARAFVEQIEATLRPPIAHHRHQYWIRGVEAWRRLRKADGLSAAPPELARTGWETLGLSGIVGRYWRLAYAAAIRLFGKWPRVTRLHPSWPDRRHLERALARAFDSPGGRVLVIRADPAHIDPLVDPAAPVDFVELQTVLTGELAARLSGKERPARAIVYLRHKECRQTKRVFESCRSAVAPGGAIEVFAHYGGAGWQAGDLSARVMEFIDDFVGASAGSVKCTFIGGALKEFADRIAAMAYRNGGAGWRGMPLALALMAFAVPFVLLAGLSSVSPRRGSASYCTSISLQFTPAGASRGGR